jgi:nitrogenase molybdenum-iron protein beta chain
MLLKHTTAEVKERKALTVNPAKTCQPIGAMYAALGIHGCLPHSHGSQGCCSYHRSALTRHYKEPVMAGTSSFTEGASVFGGQSNLVQALGNLFAIYDPEIIAVHSTCLSETIGDDLAQIIRKAAEDGKVPEGKTVIYANTPSYVGSHVTGFANMTAAAAVQLAEKTDAVTDRFNVIPGWVEPADMREIKRILRAMQVSFTMLPDTSDVLDAPMTGKHVFYPKGGTPVGAIRQMGAARKTFCLGHWASEPVGEALRKHHKVPFTALDLPIGIRATDRLLQEMGSATGCPVPDAITDERGRAVDMAADMQQYFAGKRVALWGDPDQLIPLAEFLVDLDMRPVYVVTGTPGKAFSERMKTVLSPIPEAKVAGGPQADMFLMHQWIKQEGVDLLIGNTYGKYISRDDDIPFVRMGFPIYDRVGHAQFPTVAYAGAMRIMERILSVLMDRQDRDAPETAFELVM